MVLAGDFSINLGAQLLWQPLAAVGNGNRRKPNLFLAGKSEQEIRLLDGLRGIQSSLRRTA
jgi:hypothetical protein